MKPPTRQERERTYKKLYMTWNLIKDKKSPRAQLIAKRLNIMFEEINKMNYA